MIGLRPVGKSVPLMASSAVIVRYRCYSVHSFIYSRHFIKCLILHRGASSVGLSADDGGECGKQRKLMLHRSLIPLENSEEGEIKYQA